MEVVFIPKLCIMKLSLDKLKVPLLTSNIQEEIKALLFHYLNSSITVSHGSEKWILKSLLRFLKVLNSLSETEYFVQFLP